MLGILQYKSEISEYSFSYKKYETNTRDGFHSRLDIAVNRVVRGESFLTN